MNALKNWKTTIIGIVTIAAIPLLAFFGIITPEQQQPLIDGFTAALSAIAQNAWGAAISAIVGLILVFVAHDPPKKQP